MDKGNEHLNQSGAETMQVDWKLADLELVIVACPREPDTLTATLASAFMADPAVHQLKAISVVVDNSEMNWLGYLTRHQKVRWLPWKSDEDIRASTYPIQQRASYNYLRALKSVSHETRGVIVCEDDLMLREGWLSMLMQSLEEMYRDNINDFVLALYSTHDHDKRRSRRGKFYSSYLEDCFFGTQSMFFPKTQLPHIREAILRGSVETSRLPYDFSISEYATAQQILYTTRNSLVQHVGYSTTGLGSFMHTSPTFERPWPTV